MSRVDTPPAAYRQVSQAPTLPGGAPHEPDFDVAALYETEWRFRRT